MNTQITASPAKEVEIYTDGSCLRNPGGAGGYAAIVIAGSERREISGGVRSTTNNRMELWAAIAGMLILIEPRSVRVFTDSTYVSRTYGSALLRSRGLSRKKKPMPNFDLWRELVDVCSKHKVRFVYIQGHAGDSENERCDFLAGGAARKPNLPPDFGYEERQITKQMAGMV